MSEGAFREDGCFGIIAGQRAHQHRGDSEQGAGGQHNEQGNDFAVWGDWIGPIEWLHSGNGVYAMDSRPGSQICSEGRRTKGKKRGKEITLLNQHS